MTHKAMQSETYEWEEELCDECGHPVSQHYDEPKEIFDRSGKYMYTAEGCLVLKKGGRMMPFNPYARCPCMHSK